MVLDRIGNAVRYYPLHLRLEQTLDFLRLSKDLTPRRLDLDGKQFYALLTRQQGKSQDSVKLEAHRKYIDVHYCIEGVERIGWRATVDCAKPDKSYDEENDFMTFLDPPESWVTLSPGEFAIFFPEDAHAPMVSEGIVHKAVVKIAL